MNDLKIMYMNEPIQINEKEYIWYKLCCYYHAETEKYDRSLTDKRSPYDSTEAYICQSYERWYSNRYAAFMQIKIKKIAEFYGIYGRRTNEYNYLRYSAQEWINEYERLLKAGEMKFMEDIIAYVR